MHAIRSRFRTGSAARPDRTVLLSRRSTWPPLIRRLYVCVAVGLVAACGGDDPPRLILGTTHTLEDSGLLEVLVGAWNDEHGTDFSLSVIVAGSGEILAMARRGDVDVVLSHSPDAEAALVADGDAVSRRAVMHNTFVLAGPRSDPAGASNAASVRDAFRRIAATAQPFVSRGDDSGTHRAELAVWAAAQLTPGWNGYIEAGTGMADALRLASQRRAYILTDRATYEVLSAEIDLDSVHDGGGELINQYSVLISTAARNRSGAQRLADWVVGEAAQRVIADWRPHAAGRTLYVPDGTWRRP